MNKFIKKFSEISINDIESVGGKNASLGEMINNLSSLGINVPDGFATTSYAFQEFLIANELDRKIPELLKELDVNSISNLKKTGSKIRNLILKANIPSELLKSIEEAWTNISKNKTYSFAVRSSATAEDLPTASFAGQQETYLNIVGLKALVDAMQKVYASLYTDRAIAYRVHKKFDHSEVSISVGFQRMVRSDKSTSGVMFTLDTESGSEDIIFINASYGLGETIVQGSVNPDEFYVFKDGLKNNNFPIIRKNLGEKTEKMLFTNKSEAGKSVKTVKVAKHLSNQFCISDKDVIQLAKYGSIIEKHYGKCMDIEWGKDGDDNKIYILQARPETVHSSSSNKITKFSLKENSEILITGRSIGQKIGAGITKIIDSPKNMDRVKEGDVLVADMTDPDWEPVMKRASGIITNRGGRTCHAAIIARELGIPAIVGTNNATNILNSGSPVTVSCAEGEVGKVYRGKLDYETKEYEISKLPKIPVKIMMNVGNPDKAFSFSRIPNEGVGLARLEFIINKMIGIHPKALIQYSNVDKSTKRLIDKKMYGYKDPINFFISKLSEGIATIGAAFNNKPVIVRMSDFKSNEYANLIGGKQFEPKEENPMLGFRGAGRYVSEAFKDCFQLECEAFKKVRNEMGLKNVQLMIPFIRTLKEAKDVINLLELNDLKEVKTD